MTTPPPMETLTELKINDDLKKIITEAYIPNDLPIVMAYVDEQGRPGTSFRGSTIVLGDSQLAVWARNPAGGTAKALPNNPNVTLVYRQPSPDHQRSSAVITFRGRARVDNDESVRRRVYDEMPQRERDSDPEMKGVPIVIDLDSVTGFMPGYRLQMLRS